MSEKSFSQRLRAGESKEALMKYYVLTETQYDRAVVCVERIQKGDVTQKAGA